MDIAMTLQTMLSHGRREVLDWCREVDEGPWSSLAIPERTIYTSHDCIVQLSAAAALTRRVALWTTIIILPAHDAVDIAKKMASVVGRFFSLSHPTYMPCCGCGCPVASESAPCDREGDVAPVRARRRGGRR